MAQADKGELSQDVVFNLLSNPRRRFMLSYLQRRGEPVDITDLANEIAAWENETTVDELTSQQRKRVYVSIYQTHIPKLEDAGVIEYDRESGVVAPAERIGEINTYFRGSESVVSWQAYYVALAVVGGLFYALVALAVGPFAALSTSVAGAAVVGAFALLAATHYLYNRFARDGVLIELGEERE